MALDDNVVTITPKHIFISPALYEYLRYPAEIFGTALGRNIRLLAAPGWRVYRTKYGAHRYMMTWRPDPEVPFFTGRFGAQGFFWMQAPCICISSCLSRGVLSAIPVQTKKPKKPK